jgi:hypothetical protein
VFFLLVQILHVQSCSASSIGYDFLRTIFSALLHIRSAAGGFCKLTNLFPIPCSNKVANFSPIGPSIFLDTVGK